MPALRYALPLTCTVLAASAAMTQTVVTPAAPSAAEPAPVATVAPAPAAPAPACELHVWPAARVGALTQGVGAGFGLIGALIDASAHADQNKRDTAFITGTLDAHAQAEVLRELDLPSKLHLPPSQVIFHDEGVDIKRDNPQRLSSSTAQCYTEFVVRSLSYFQNVMYSGQMWTFFEVRRFDGARVTVDFRASKHEVLAAKLPREGEDTGPATDALHTAFRDDVALFADKFARKYP